MQSTRVTPEREIERAVQASPRLPLELRGASLAHQGCGGIVWIDRLDGIRQFLHLTCLECSRDDFRIDPTAKEKLPKTPPRITTLEACEILGCHPGTLHRYALWGRLRRASDSCPGHYTKWWLSEVQALAAELAEARATRVAKTPIKSAEQRKRWLESRWAQGYCRNGVHPRNFQPGCPECAERARRYRRSRLEQTSGKTGAT